uniref:Uncharacterized protein n=1 Tax=Meloidogyne hapla TaxID=6305 RepID=A0A1I8B5C2_MELHA
MNFDLENFYSDEKFKDESFIKGLDECINILEIEKSEHYAYNLKALYNRFNSAQFYHKNLPEYEGSFVVTNKIDNECTVCHENIKIGEFAQKTTCKPVN